MRIYVASSNTGKLADFRAAVTGADLHLEPMPGLAGIAPPAENEDTFEGNARVKAVYYSRFMPDAWVIADDSGLEVDALGGRPGVRSARFAEDLAWQGEAIGVDPRNNEALLAAMDDKQVTTARYRCALALACNGEVEAVTFGWAEGEILREPRGSGGFGYDPLFLVKELGCTMAEATMADRLNVSHRGRALRAMVRRLASVKAHGGAEAGSA